MSGMQIEALRRTKLYLATPTTPVPINPLAQFIDTLGWVSGVLQVRIYSANFSVSPQGQDAAVRFAVYNTSVSQEDPAVTLIEPTPLTFVQVDSTSPGNAALPLLVSAIPHRMSRYVSVQMSTILLGTATSVSGDITVGVDLIGRTS